MITDESERIIRLQELMDLYDCDEDVAELLLEDELEDSRSRKEPPVREHRTVQETKNTYTR